MADRATLPGMKQPTATRSLVDCHFHSEHSCDSHAPLTALCQRALHLGLSYLCPTEHADFDPQDICYGHLNVEAYSQAVADCREQFAGHLTLLKGIEIDYQPRFDAEVRAFLAQHTFDFVVGSVHYADGSYVGDSLLEAYDPDTAYRRYFDAVRQAAASGLFDVIGHLDLLKRHGIPRWGAFDPRRYADEIDAILQAAAETGTGLEINTSGLRQAPGETYPCPETLRRYRELGGKVLTLGSDAHRVANLGRNIRDGLALARAVGFEAIAVFVERQPCWLNIGDQLSLARPSKPAIIDGKYPNN
jgi:histidinol-phosphatase (PHP family)